MGKIHQLPDGYADYLRKLDKWHSEASSYGAGSNKSLEVEVGGRRFRVISHGIEVYRGTDADKAVEIYEKED